MIWITLGFIGIFLFIFLRDITLLKITPNPTSKKIQKAIFDICPLDIEGPIYELGSGVGHMAFSFVKKFPHLKVKSFERATLPYLFQRVALKVFKRPQVELIYRNFLDQDLSEARVIFCYLYHKIMPKLLEKIESEAKHKTIVITHTFALGNQKPTKTIQINDLYKTKVYLYEVFPKGS